MPGELPGGGPPVVVTDGEMANKRLKRKRETKLRTQKPDAALGCLERPWVLSTKIWTRTL